VSQGQGIIPQGQGQDQGLKPQGQGQSVKDKAKAKAAPVRICATFYGRPM